MKQLQPKLRFYQYTDKWISNKISDRMDVFRGASPRPKGSPKYYGGSVPRLMIEDATRDGKYTIPKIDTLTEEGARKSRFLPKGSPVLSCSGTKVGIPTILSVDACIHDGWLGFKNFSDVDSEFLYYNFLKLYDTIQSSATTGGVFNNLTTGIIKDYIIFFPTLPEQTKIASFLTTVDEKISGLKKQLTLLERYKKGVMQKIFSQELRFKDENGNDFPDWEKLAISQLFDSKKGSGLSKDKLSNKGKYKCLLYGELFTTYKEKITSIVSFTDSLEGVCVELNDILVPGSTTTSGIDLSKFSALKVSDVRVGGDVTILKSRQKIESVFYAYYLSNFKKREIGNKAQGITIVHLSFSNFKDIIIDFPSFSEQQKIASFLSSIDEKIEKCQGQIKAMENWKKGLLQQMFV
jgi:type I restriction enzyme S subunit